MNQWSESTSLRLLELIAAGVEVGGIQSHLQALAQRDAEFGRWLCACVDSACTSQHFESCVEANWLGWLAVLSDSSRLFRDCLPGGDPSLDLQTEGRPDAPIDKVLRVEQSSRGDVCNGDARCADEFGALPIRGETCHSHGSIRLMQVVSAMAKLAVPPSPVSRAAEVAEVLRTEKIREIAYDMAYGLSHELNNPLANISTRARLLAEEEPDPRKRSLLASIVDQAMRGCEMIADLMLVARPPALKLELVDITSEVAGTSERARPWAEARQLALEVVLPQTAIWVTADQAAIREALWALVRNSIEAARHKIVIELNQPTGLFTACDDNGVQRMPITSHLDGTTSQDGRLDHDSAQDRDDVPSILVLSIVDDGPGLSDEGLAHAFHPYYSGREAGRGLGLGLAKADRLAQASGGYVTIENQRQGGCKACMIWPLK